MSIIQQLLLPVFAWILIISGTIMLGWPKAARFGFTYHSGKMLTGWLIMGGLFLFSLLFSIAPKLGGLFVLAGIIAIIIAFFMLKGAAMKKINALAQTLTAQQLQIFSIAQIVLGVATLLLNRKFI